MNDLDSVVRVSTTLDNLFKHWLEFLRPFHGLTNKEIEVVACLLKHRHYLSSKVKDDKLLNTLVFDIEIKKKVMEECNIKAPHFQVMLGNLRKNGIIVDNQINKRYIPNIKEDKNSFQLLIHFDINESK